MRKQPDRWLNYDPVEAFWAQVSKTDACWLWTGYTDKDGYGIFGSKVFLKQHSWGKRAHKISWLLDGRTVPKGLVLDHLCETKPCVNPDHLEPITSGENTRRYHASKKKSRRVSA